MKKQLFFKSFLLLCALIIGGGKIWATDVTYTISSKNTLSTTGTAPTGSSASIVETYNTSCQMTNGNSQTLTLKSYNGLKITKIVLSMKSNSSKGKGKLSYSTDGGSSYTYLIGGASSDAAFNTASWYGSWSTSYVNITKSGLNIVCGESDVKIKIEATENSLYCQSYTITYEESKTLSSITLTGTYPTSFTEKDDFSHEGMTVTANYEDSSTKNVTSLATFSGYNMEEIGDQTVTVSYTEGSTTKTQTYGITVNAGTKYIVTYDAEAGTCAKATDTEAEYKGGVTLPTATCSKAGWVFVGWATSTVSSTATRPATLYKAGATYKPTSNTTLHAVYKLADYDATKFVRVTSVEDLEYALAVVIVNNNSKYVLNHNRETEVDAPTETSSKITPAANTIFTLGGNNTTGYTLTGANGTLGVATLPTTSRATSWTESNNKWIVEEHEDTPNLFVLRNANSTNVALEYYNAWVAYKVNTYASNTNTSMKLYVPETLYNSNPAADIITPDVAFSKGGTTLYLDSETLTYTNTASVSNVDKPISYESSNTSVATVSSAGVVTAVGIGTATITATVAAELGVNKVGTDTYDVVVKNTTTIAGLKNLYSTAQSPAKAFAADLTDAVVTYVNGNYAYIQDATGAIYASCGSSLTAGKKINGAVSGTITAPNGIDEIKTIDLSGATLTDAEVPAAEVKTLAQIVANAASLDGKKVTVNAATVSTGMSNATSGGVITDDGGTTTVNIIAPNKLTLKATEIGNFTGFVSTYVSGVTTTYRLNIYEASQYVKTQNVATAQTLTFADDDVQLDEVTDALTAYTGQSVQGAHTTVTYEIDDSSDDIIGDFNTSTGALTLNGACGSAIINVSAAAENIVEAGVTTPYLAAEGSYMITVNPRYVVTFAVNGVETTLRQATSGASIAVPAVADINGYKHVGWSTATVAPTDTKPSMADLGTSVTPANNNGKYYAVFAMGAEDKEEQDATSTFSFRNTSQKSPSVIDNVTWTFSGLTFLASGNNCGMPNGATITFSLPANVVKTKSIVATQTQNWSTSNITIALTDADGKQLTTFNDAFSYDFTDDNNKSTAYTLKATNKSSKTAWISQITVTYVAMVDNTTYSDYRTSLPVTTVTIGESTYTSFCYDRDLDFSGTDVSAYTAKANGEGESVVLTKITDGIVPAGTGVILHADAADTYEIPVTTTDKVIADNELRGVLVRTLVAKNETRAAVEYTNYIFSKKDDVLGFYRATTAGAYLLANRAYLSTTKVTADGGARYMDFAFGDEGMTTGVRSLTPASSPKGEGSIYTLSGQKVQQPQKGLYIVNGKKVVLK